MNDFLQGIITVNFLAIGLFFFRFYKDTKDRLFLWFAISFFTMSINRFLLFETQAVLEERTWLFLIRLAAFLMIIIAIIDKNRPAKKDKEAE